MAELGQRARFAVEAFGEVVSLRAVLGQELQNILGVLIGAVLAPHDAEDAELHGQRLAAQALQDQRVLLAA